MAAVRGSGVLDASQVRIRGADGEVVGAGFLVAPDLVCTCAHVIGQACGPAHVGGFSGSPVWDDTQDGVVGMTVAAHQGDRTAYLLPSADLVDGRALRPRCPFQGLAPFAEDGAEFFHGRDDDTRRVFRAVSRRPVTLVVGPSGCGKSSLVRAGVLPKARGAGMDVSAVRAVLGVPAAAVLARALTDLLDPAPGEVERLAWTEKLARLLEAGRDVPAELRSRLLARPGAAPAGHLLADDPGAVRAHQSATRTRPGRTGTGDGQARRPLPGPGRLR
ncbi:ATP-binding protein [Streptomyces sp. NPDC058892]|uniref:ATP-binding protein n=1 Tax=unclassified Streptomyces TaxID=2593676 RepID=UPI00369356D4